MTRRHNIQDVGALAKCHLPGRDTCQSKGGNGHDTTRRAKSSAGYKSLQRAVGRHALRLQNVLAPFPIKVAAA